MPLSALARPAPRSRRSPRRAPRVPPPAAAGVEVLRHRHAGGPDDSALYACACGRGFRAAVTASVACPRCGVEQAW